MLKTRVSDPQLKTHSCYCFCFNRSLRVMDEILQMRNPTSFLSLLFLISFSLLPTLSFSLLPTFSPTDNYLISCGSAVDSTVDNRRFVSDSTSPYLLATGSIPVSNQNPSPDSTQIYNTARVFKHPSRYVFKIQDHGTHLVRLHFQSFAASNLDLKDALFHVLVNDHVVLSNFTLANYMRNSVIKEYFIWVDSDKVVVTFVPSEADRFGFVNAIEVISAPEDLIGDTATLVNGNKDEKFDGLATQSLETVYRVNVGGSKVTPVNDTVWRTWIPDDEFFKSSNVSSRVHFSGQIKYQSGGASRQVGPDFVYNTARVITSTDRLVPNVNMTWEFQVVEGYKYLVRLHFCDIASVSLGLLNFDIYINGVLAYENFDISYITYRLASPVYADFVVDYDKSGFLSVSVGPSNFSSVNEVVGMLNGLEVMKMNNSLGSLDGKICAGMVLKNWRRGIFGVLIPVVAVVCLLLSLYAVVSKRALGMLMRNPFEWSKLPTDVQEGNLKHGNQNV